MTSSSPRFEFDVALSFAGEDRAYVEAIAALLRSHGIRVFYDQYEQAKLWGKDLYQNLDYIYQRASRYCVLFASAHYARKAWTSHELKSAQARALYERGEYILPVRFDDTEIPGLRPTVAYIDARIKSRDQVVELILQKLDERLTGAPLDSDRTRTPRASVPPAPHISPSPKPAADQAVQRGAHRIERSPYLAGVSEHQQPWVNMNLSTIHRALELSARTTAIIPFGAFMSQAELAAVNKEVRAQLNIGNHAVTTSPMHDVGHDMYVMYASNGLSLGNHEVGHRIAVVEVRKGGNWLKQGQLERLVVFVTPGNAFVPNPNRSHRRKSPMVLSHDAEYGLGPILLQETDTPSGGPWWPNN